MTSAFDRVWREKSREKLHNIGVRGETLTWIADFLRGRRLKVWVNGELSKEGRTCDTAVLDLSSWSRGPRHHHLLSGEVRGLGIHRRSQNAWCRWRRPGDSPPNSAALAEAPYSLYIVYKRRPRSSVSQSLVSLRSSPCPPDAPIKDKPFPARNLLVPFLLDVQDASKWNLYLLISPLAQLCRLPPRLHGRVDIEEPEDEISLTTCGLVDPPFSENEVKLTAFKFGKRKSPGPEGIDNTVVKALLRMHPSLLARFFNRCLETGTFPEAWKVARVVLLEKSGRKGNSPNDYRPLSLLVCLGMVLDSLLALRLKHWLESNELLSSFQHGFREGNSTTTALNEVLEGVEMGLNKGAWVLLVALDIDGALVRDLLRDRRISLSLGGRRLERNCARGCPQGSCCGPIMWNILENTVFQEELPEGAWLVLYADDQFLIIEAASRAKAEKCVEASLQILSNWAHDSGLKFNVSKTKAFSFKPRDIRTKRKGIKWEHKSAIRMKGRRVALVIDDKMGWQYQAEEMVTRGREALCRPVLGSEGGKNSRERAEDSGTQNHRGISHYQQRPSDRRSGRTGKMPWDLKRVPWNGRGTQGSLRSGCQSGIGVLEGRQGLIDTEVFTDGSKSGTNTGAGVVIFTNGELIFQESLTLRVDELVFPAELVAIRVALRTCAEKNFSPDRLYSDCMSALVAINLVKGQLAHQIIQELEMITRAPEGCFRGRSLRTPVTKKEVYRRIRGHIQDLWLDRWRKSVKGERVVRDMGSSPSLHRFKIKRNPDCVYEERDVDARHYVLDCPRVVGVQEERRRARGAIESKLLRNHSKLLEKAHDVASELFLNCSILSPILFNLYINDIPHIPQCRLALFADDTALLSSSRSPDILISRLQNYLEIICNWCDKWKLNLNPKKSQAIIFPPQNSFKFTPRTNLIIYSSPINWTQQVKYLGVTFDSKLKFTSHVKDIIRKSKIAKASLSNMFSSKSGLSVNQKFTLYRSCILPIVTYALPVWFKYITLTDRKRIDAFMRICLRSTVNAPFNLSNAILKQDLNQPNIEEIYISSTQKLYLKLSTSQNPVIQELFQFDGDLNPRHKRPGLHSTRTVTFQPPPLTAYTDGSSDLTLSYGGAGINIILQDGTHIKIKEGAGQISSNFTCELTAIWKALDVCLNQPSLHKAEGILIYSDSISSLEAIQKGNTNITRKIHSLLTQMKPLENNCILQWIPAHAGIGGNEMTSELAKEARNVLMKSNREFENRAAIIVALRAGRSPKEIVDFLKLPKTTIYRVKKQFDEADSNKEGIATRKKHSRRSDRVRGEEFVKNVKEKIDGNPGKSMRAIAKEMDVGSMTIVRTIHEDLGLKSYALRKGQLLTENMKNNRKGKAAALLNNLRHDSFGMLRFFSDEKNFDVDQKVNPRNDRWICKDPSEIPVVMHTKFPASVMVLGVISSEGDVMPPHFFEKGLRMNADTYINVLETVVKPWMDMVAAGRKYVFQQDSAPAHKAKKTQSWLTLNVPSHWGPDIWPPNSPDCNPLDYYVWGVVERDVNKAPHTTIQSVKKAVHTVMTQMDKVIVAKACASFRTRLETVVANNGNYIE
ncbi:hypothetical protein LAZ67_16002604 [Cordylochernes scorpioides]|uniref:RNase H type-1 domain-containing protein n=1 Tax=Cordylochernes scorpioides TaxID=51811 RepID=A0ABY6LGW1_9ARAC|nr:hypothetical protein LAZ67_16002604 [Cordylochernes scorpioides]